jgi:hypothetical protein
MEDSWKIEGIIRNSNEIKNNLKKNNIKINP